MPGAVDYGGESGERFARQPMSICALIQHMVYNKYIQNLDCRGQYYESMFVTPDIWFVEDAPSRDHKSSAVDRTRLD